ncbi:MAG: divergent polysaccharide deacetylase family protein [Paracoccaceae bacterium]|nr:divergent polysaccharide deacetylase family protein [Paracoccaceae bacterium]
MGRGLILGMAAGLVTSVLALSVVSLVLPAPRGTVRPASSVAAVTKPDAVPAAASNSAATQSTETVKSAALPPMGSDAPGLAPAPVADAAPMTPAATDAPVENPPSDGPSVAGSEPAPNLVVGAPQPSVAQQVPVPASAPDAAAAPSLAVVAPEAPSSAVPAAPAVSAVPNAPAAASPPATAPVINAATPPGLGGATATDPNAPQVRVPDSNAASTPPAAPEGDMPHMIVLDSSRPSVGFAKSVQGVIVNRLPQIGGASAAAVDPLPDSNAVQVPPPSKDGALAHNAVTFDNQTGRPEVAVILIDSGALDLNRAELAAAKIPLTLAVDPTVSGAERAAKTYHDGGHEVLILATAVPPLATASDLETTFQSYFHTIGQAVGVMDVASGGFQGDRMTSQRIATILADAGYGLVTYERGLNAAAQVATSAKLPNVQVYSTVESSDGGGDVLRQTLDRAAFRAAQDGHAAVVAPASSDTLAALEEWQKTNRGQSVVIAPVSAVMTR